MSARGRERRRARLAKLTKARARIRARGPVARANEMAIDPIARAEREGRDFLTSFPIYLGAAAVINVAFVFAVGGASAIFGGKDEAAPNEPIEVAIIDSEPEPVVETPPEPEPEPEPEPAVETQPEPEPEPEPKAEPKPTKTSAEPPAEPEPEPKPKAKRIVGLDLGSTVEGGQGPAFATGNTQLGSTATRAADPSSVGEDPGPAPRRTAPKASPAPNKKARFIPGTAKELIKPKRKKRVKPVYPPKLEAQGIEANVMVKVEIDATGKVTSVKIIKPAREPEFNAAAEKAAWQEVFSPAVKDGKPIPFSLSYTYRFRKDE